MHILTNLYAIESCVSTLISYSHISMNSCAYLCIVMHANPTPLGPPAGGPRLSVCVFTFARRLAITRRDAQQKGPH